MNTFASFAFFAVSFCSELTNDQMTNDQMVCGGFYHEEGVLSTIWA